MPQCQKCKRPKSAPDFQIVTKNMTRTSKVCSSCRSKVAKRGAKYRTNSEEKYRAARKKYLESETRAEYIETTWKSAPRRAIRAADMRETRKTDSYKRYRSSDSYKESKKREYKKMKDTPGAKLVHYIHVALSDAAPGRQKHFSGKMEKYTEFSSNDDAKEHFESMFEPGMDWSNHSHTGWNIGHRIAKAHYDFEKEEDIKRCWKKANLFPQWATGEGGNCSMRTKFPKKRKLVELKECWPTSWNDILPKKSERVRMECACNMKG
tara:strand:+ start:573 stop:1367 length:795 start_codon:yes stop_codon:yes gene_type:complete